MRNGMFFRKILWIAGCLAVVLGATSCSQTAVERDALDLRDRLDALHDSLESVDSLAVETALIEFRMHLEALAPYAADSSKRDVVVSDGTTLDRSAKNLFKFQAQKRVWMGVLRAGSARLTSLAHDVNTEYVDTALGRKYLRDEQGALGYVVRDARSRLHAAQWCLTRKDSISERMEQQLRSWAER